MSGDNSAARRRVVVPPASRASTSSSSDSSLDASLEQQLKNDVRRAVAFNPMRCVLCSLCLSFVLFAVAFGFMAMERGGMFSAMRSPGSPEQAKTTFEVLVPGALDCERSVVSGDRIRVHYEGRLKVSGKKFDSSYDRGEAYVFRVGDASVIEGWSEGVLGMCKGEKRRVTIPSHKGYGGKFMSKIPPHSTLEFDIELLDTPSRRKF